VTQFVKDPPTWVKDLVTENVAKLFREYSY
jgi:hypothetical protein